MSNWMNQQIRTKEELISALKRAVMEKHLCNQNIGGLSYCPHCGWINPNPQVFLPGRYVTLYQQVFQILTALESKQGDTIFNHAPRTGYHLMIDLYENGTLSQMSTSLIWSTYPKWKQFVWIVWMRIRYPSMKS